MQKVLFVFLFFILVTNSYSQNIIAASSYSQKTSRPKKIRVIGNSLLAKAAARLNGEETFAVTIGRTIFVSCKKEDFYKKDWWVRHELTHVAQYQKHGILPFLSLYLYYSVFHHKTENPFEKEAEDAEFSSD